MNASPSAEEETEVRNGGEYLGIIDVIWIVTFFKFLRRIEDVTDYSLHCQYTLGNVWQQWTVDSWASHSLNIQVFLSHALAKNVIQLFSGCAQLRSNIIYLNGNIHIQGHFSSLFFDETLTVCTHFQTQSKYCIWGRYTSFKDIRKMLEGLWTGAKRSVSQGDGIKNVKNHTYKRLGWMNGSNTPRRSPRRLLSMSLLEPIVYLVHTCRELHNVTYNVI